MYLEAMKISSNSPSATCRLCTIYFIPILSCHGYLRLLPFPLKLAQLLLQLSNILRRQLHCPCLAQRPFLLSSFCRQETSHFLNRCVQSISPTLFRKLVRGAFGGEVFRQFIGIADAGDQRARDDVGVVGMGAEMGGCRVGGEHCHCNC
jgi:hypothetical protein